MLYILKHPQSKTLIGILLHCVIQVNIPAVCTFHKQQNNQIYSEHFNWICRLFRKHLNEVTLIYYQQNRRCQFAASINRNSRKICMIQAHEEYHKGVRDPNSFVDHKNLNRESLNRVAQKNVAGVWNRIKRSE